MDYPHKTIIFQLSVNHSDIKFLEESTRWISDELDGTSALYLCSGRWAEKLLWTVYVGGIRFYNPISINVAKSSKVECAVIYNRII